MQRECKHDARVGGCTCVCCLERVFSLSSQGTLSSRHVRSSRTTLGRAPSLKRVANSKSKT
jgi:hypothetical protein